MPAHRAKEKKTTNNKLLTHYCIYTDLSRYFRGRLRIYFSGETSRYLHYQPFVIYDFLLNLYGAFCLKCCEMESKNLPEQKLINQTTMNEHLIRWCMKITRGSTVYSAEWVGNHAEADDLTQETFIKVYQSLPQFRQESSIQTWIYRIAINKGLNHLRRLKIRQTFGLEYADNAVEQKESGSSEAVRNFLRSAIAKLPPRQQMIIILRSFQELSFKEIAAILDITENAAKVNYSHALKNLRQAFLKMGVNYETLFTD
jgi:RNA polymerase sigma-70 factor (ECF subfamily)